MDGPREGAHAGDSKRSTHRYDSSSVACHIDRGLTARFHVDAQRCCVLPSTPLLRCYQAEFRAFEVQAQTVIKKKFSSDPADRCVLKEPDSAVDVFSCLCKKRVIFERVVQRSAVDGPRCLIVTDWGNSSHMASLPTSGFQTDRGHTAAFFVDTQRGLSPVVGVAGRSLMF